VRRILPFAVWLVNCLLNGQARCFRPVSLEAMGWLNALSIRSMPRSSALDLEKMFRNSCLRIASLIGDSLSRCAERRFSNGGERLSLFPDIFCENSMNAMNAMLYPSVY